MKLIEPKVEELKQEDGIQGIYKIIDEVAGICYDRHTLHKNSEQFVKNLISRGHMRPLEFATVYLQIPQIVAYLYEDIIKSPYSKYNRVSIDENHYCFVTTNFRVIVEHTTNGTFDDIFKYRRDYIEAPEFFFKRPILKFICSRAVADEFRTHISLSSMMKSTRYCKFDDLDICRPQWLDTKWTTENLNILLENPEFGLYDEEDDDEEYCEEEYYRSEYLWWYTLQMSESGYRDLLSDGMSPQQARGVLPMDMATELVMCGYKNFFNTGWKRFLELRTDSSAHPDAQNLAQQANSLLKYV